MKLFRLVIPALLVLPAPGFAQTLKPADLLGTWVFRSLAGGFEGDKMGTLDWALTFRADSVQRLYVTHSFTRATDGAWSHTKDKVKAERKLESWALQGDTLTTAGRTAGTGAIATTGTFVVTLQGQQLRLKNVQDSTECPFLLERTDSAQLATPKLDTATFKRADLVGTWARGTNAKDKSQSDTLTLRADGTFRSLNPGFNSGAPVVGQWDIAPGNYLYLSYQDSVALKRGQGQSTKLLLSNAGVSRDGGQLVIDEYHGGLTECRRGMGRVIPGYKRIGP